MNELQLGAILNELVGLNETESTRARGELYIDTSAQNQIGVCALPTTQCGTDEV